MNHYVTGNTNVQALDSPLLKFTKDCGTLIKLLREKQKMIQAQLAERLCVSDKTISKWETGRGFPDISFLEPLAKILKVSVLELLSGNEIIKLYPEQKAEARIKFGRRIKIFAYCNRHGLFEVKV